MFIGRSANMKPFFSLLIPVYNQVGLMDECIESINAQKFEDYDIKKEELELLEQQKTKGVQGAGKEWENYITKRCRLTVSEQVFFQPFENILTDESPKKICCFIYKFSHKWYFF